MIFGASLCGPLRPLRRKTVLKQRISRITRIRGELRWKFVSFVVEEGSCRSVGNSWVENPPYHSARSISRGSRLQIAISGRPSVFRSPSSVFCPLSSVLCSLLSQRLDVEGSGVVFLKAETVDGRNWFRIMGVAWMRRALRRAGGSMVWMAQRGRSRAGTLGALR
jgi:hypothetical protein